MTPADLAALSDAATQAINDARSDFGCNSDEDLANALALMLAECRKQRDGLLVALRNTVIYLEHPEGQAPNGWRLRTTLDVARASIAIVEEQNQ